MKGIIAILLLSFFSIAFAMPGLKQEQIRDIVNEINMQRRNVLPSSSNMREIRWSECLQTLAGNYLLQCNPSGSSNTMRNTQAMGARCESPLIGETIFNISYFAIFNPIRMWAAQKEYYINGQCDEYDCSDYLQLVDSGSFAVGCEMISESMKCGRPGMTYVCYFALDGTTSEDGLPCTKCEGEYKHCNNGLCSHRRGGAHGNGQGGNSHSHQHNGNHGNHELPKPHGNNGNHGRPILHASQGNHVLPEPHGNQGNHGTTRPHGDHGNHGLPEHHGNHVNHGTHSPHGNHGNHGTHSPHGNHGNHGTPRPHGHQDRSHPHNDDNTWQH